MVGDLTVTDCRMQNNKMTFFHKWQDRDCPHEECNFYITFSSVAQSCPTLCNSVDYSCQASLSITNSQSLLKLMSIESVMPSNHLILCCPLLLLPSMFPSIRVFSSESLLPIRWPKYWSFNFSISPSSEYSGLTDLITLQSKSRVFSNTTVQKHQFFSALKNPPTIWEPQETWVRSLG